MEDKWMARYEEVIRFIETNHRNPSRHRIEEHNMPSWLKQQRKRIKAGIFMSDRMKMFEKLQVLMDEYKRVNQWV